MYRRLPFACLAMYEAGKLHDTSTAAATLYESQYVTCTG